MGIHHRKGPKRQRRGLGAAKEKLQVWGGRGKWAEMDQNATAQARAVGVVKGPVDVFEPLPAARVSDASFTLYELQDESGS
jgi:hypothetical protein